MKILLLDNYLDWSGRARDIFSPYFPTNAALNIFSASNNSFPKSLNDYSHIVLTGSGTSANSPDDWVKQEKEIILEAEQNKIPLLGICFGHQLIAATLGGRVIPSATPEFGWENVAILHSDSLFNGIPNPFTTFCSHFEEVVTLPAAEFTITSRSDRCNIQSYRHLRSPIWGVQFHCEYSPEWGEKSLKNTAAQHPRLNLNIDQLMKKSGEKSHAPNLFNNFFDVSN